MKLLLRLACAIIAISTGAFCLISFFTWTDYIKTINAMTKDKFEELAFHALDTMDRNFFERSSDIQIMASDPIISSKDSSPQQITERLIAFRNIYRMFVSVSFFDMKRIRIADTAGLNLGEQGPDHDYWEDVVQGKMSIATTIGIEPSLNVPIVFFATPVRDKDGQIFGAVIARMPVDKLYEIVGDISIFDQVKKAVHIDLAGKDGVLIYSNHNRKGILKDTLPDWAELVKDYQGKRSGFKDAHRHPGEEEFFSVFCREQGYLDFKGNDWILIIHIPTRIVFAPIVDLRIKWFLVVIPFALLTIIVTLILAVKYSKPLTKLGDAAKEAGKGRLDVRVNIKSYDEVGELVDVFNRMLDHLQKTTTSKASLEQEVDQRKKTEEALQYLSQQNKLILDSSAEGILGLNIGGNHIFVNPAAARMLGYDVEELLGQPSHSIWHHTKADGSLYPREECPIYAAYQDGKVHHVSSEVFWRKDGTSFPVEYSSTPINEKGRLTGAVVVFSDITERKRVEEELSRYHENLEGLVKERTGLLQASEERYKKITSSITDYIYTVRVKNGSPVSTTYNLGCQAVTGYKPEEFLSRPLLWIEIVVEEDRPIVEKQIQGIYSGKEVEPIEHRIVHKNGHICWVHHTTVLQYDAEGRLTAYDGLIADITERKKTEEAMLQAKEAAERALAFKDEFTSTVSHELRTPLAAIKSSIDILNTEAPGKLTDDQKVFIKRVKSNIDRLARLINDVLDLSKLESGKMTMNLLPLQPAVLVQEIVDMHSVFVKSKGLAIEAKVGKDVPVLLADKDRLIQVFNNLVNNAMKFTKEGRISVAAYHDDDRQLVTFCVRDTGIGIKEEDQAKIFQKFQQVGDAHQQVGGTGLGLAICSEIVTRHRGRIWVESQYGEGSAFYFTIPLVKAKRILVVDDDPVVRELVKKTLEGAGKYEIELVSDGFSAGEKYHELKPHLVILDIQIPKVNGLEVCSRIKREPEGLATKIMMVSSFDTEAKEKEAWEAGADDILRKPINSKELITKVVKLI